MGYTVRVDKYRYTGWFGFNATAARANFSNVVATELYVHNEAPLPVDWAVEHVNVVDESGMSAVVKQLHEVLVKCGPRPDLCPPALLKGLV
jgi:iduronate 2-sulfatase/deleted-in-malignant-brain-tumors protein 1